ncbi:MAG: hypothetical protein EAZ32_01820 [Cytophagia bacterium]|nr:MAG: hypothetical protein EAZ46_01185 [Runella sp.]TAG22987.1 MAG: hypothetical protein EAZ38_04295 [Cytophagales bacterium]TAG42041.1 MAG: hypothetical protein EAZ32_01820 [Cytophagia bacterium]TAG54615.1 MAG: hypothetical protein EAZ29_04400 [Runella slithyformis]TAG83741.1 MAG: hypothetical protein EAZ22_01885 [Cytophagales bacterium]
MTKTTRQYIIHSLIHSFIILSLLASCSQQIPPTGGKKDIIAPELVQSIPKNKQTNYTGKSVELKFDEYVVIEGLQQKLLITPDAGEYDTKVLPEGLRLTFKKPLEKDRTYSLSFGDAVKDFSERNPAKNLRLVFSTGAALDSAAVRGNVRDLQSNKPTFETLVGLYRNSDTLNPEKMKPVYFTRTDSLGNFSIENIQSNSYRLIALEDQNRSLTYNMKVEKIAFLPDSLLIKDSTQISGVSLGLFLANRSPQKVKTTQPRAFYYTIVYERGFTDFKVNFNNPTDSLPYFQSSPTELKFFNTKSRKDTVVAKITLRDSLGLAFEHTQKIKFRESKANTKNPEQNRDSFEGKAKLEENQEIIPGKIAFKLTFNKPIVEARLEQIKMRSDSTKNEDLQPSNFIWTNNRTEFTIETRYQATKELKIVIPKNTFFTLENDTLPAKTYRFNVMEEENYGTIEGVVKNAKDNFIVELLNDKYEVVKSVASETNFQFNYIKPSIYFIRAIVDKNKNNKWDTGNFKTKLLAEPIIFLPEPIKVKKNFVLSGYILDLSTK